MGIYYKKFFAVPERIPVYQETSVRHKKLLGKTIFPRE
jgi:hypothetical protein